MDQAGTNKVNPIQDGPSCRCSWMGGRGPQKDPGGGGGGGGGGGRGPQKDTPPPPPTLNKVCHTYPKIMAVGSYT